MDHHAFCIVSGAWNDDHGGLGDGTPGPDPGSHISTHRGTHGSAYIGTNGGTYGSTYIGTNGGTHIASHRGTD